MPTFNLNTKKCEKIMFEPEPAVPKPDLEPLQSGSDKS